VSTLDHTLKSDGSVVRRLEVITGTGRRRQFSADDKARIIEETLVPGAVVSEVARRHGLSPQQLFGWRRQARRLAETTSNPETPAFVPAVVETPSQRRTKRQDREPMPRTDVPPGTIEVEIDGVMVRVGRGAEVKTLTAVLRALKADA
jgi:transposase